MLFCLKNLRKVVSIAQLLEWIVGYQTHVGLDNGGILIDQQFQYFVVMLYAYIVLAN